MKPVEHSAGISSGRTRLIATLYGRASVQESGACSVGTAYGTFGRPTLVCLASVATMLCALVLACAPALAAMPLIGEESTINVSGTSATLQAEVNPNETATSYRFEYGTAEYTGDTPLGQSAPTPEGAVTEGSAPVTAEAHVQGLTSATTYHFRVVATNSAHEVVYGKDRTFTTTSSGDEFTLPDNRAWEMVSPPDKHGAGIEPLTDEGGEIQAAADGSAITYVATGPVTGEPAGNRAPELSQVYSKRMEPGVWETQDISSPNEAAAEYAVGQGSEYRLFSSELSEGLLQPRGETPLTPEATEKTLYLRNDETGSYLPLVTPVSVGPGRPFGYKNGTGDLEFDGASSDLKHVVFGSQQALTSEVAAETPGLTNLYEWSSGALQLVSVLPNGHPASEPDGEGKANLAVLGGTGGGMVRNAVSNDGTRVVWKDNENLYLRDLTTKETVQLDQFQAGATENPNYGAELEFQGASSDGQRVFFTDAQPLTVGSHAEAGEPDLYVAEIAQGAHLAVSVVDLTEDTTLGEPADVHGRIQGYSEDGDYVYFAAQGSLMPGATQGSCASEEPSSTCNLYVDHLEPTSLGTSWVPQLVAKVASFRDGSDWARNLPNETSRVSPNGMFMAFMSDHSLTGYDNRDALNGEPDEEVYLYAAASRRVMCASCDPTGARPRGLRDLPEVKEFPEPLEFPGPLVDYPGSFRTSTGYPSFAGSIPGWTANEEGEAEYQSRYLSDEGRLFFNSADALVPLDTNGLEDVYEYEPQGVGNCEGTSSTTGSRIYKPGATFKVEEGTSQEHTVQEGASCVGLISSGTSSEESAFLDASESGNDVFFMTSARLAEQDYDKSYDIYDAHICGAEGIACSSAVASSPACTTAESCRAAALPQPAIYGSPASATFSGAGNAGPAVVAKPVAKAKQKPLTRAQKLAAALKACAKKARKKRATCEATARKKFAAKDRSTTKKSNGRTK
jgi:hypothetical protein